MKFEEQEVIDDSSEDIVEEPEIETKGEETQPMLDYNNIKSSQDIEVPPLLQYPPPVWAPFILTPGFDGGDKAGSPYR